jgi:hypothetical protein
MEYTEITRVRYYYRDTWTFWSSGPVLELSGKSGDRIAMQFGPFISPAHLAVVYDVLKKKAPQANLRNSAGVFFSRPDAIVGSGSPGPGTPPGVSDGKDPSGGS